MILGLCLSLLWAGPGEELVDVQKLVPDLALEIRYATLNNFLGRKLYPVARCLLRPEVARRLGRAADRLRKQGFRLKAYDCYRPHSVQWELWKAFPREGFVADPMKGSNHNRGAAVDVTLVRLDGSELTMPTDFDAFVPEASHGAKVAEEKARHREMLLEAMRAAGFRPHPKEWWHYDAPEAKRYPVLDRPL